ncbi:LptF/LptG family permease [Treponema sp.]|uniref:LptF/LptG family permease n=1 Tax=Treponema sp. TaxID=166 RepID=UPI003890D27A
MAGLVWKLKRFLNAKKSEILKKIRKSKGYFPVKRVIVSVIYYRRTWAKSQLKKNLEEYGKLFVQKYNEFNLLNSLARGLAFIFYKLKFNKTSNFFKSSMQEENGINRHVLFRYLMKELFLYFFIAFIFFFMVFFVNQILLVAENILKKHVPVMDVMRLITYSLPMVIAQSAPFATLVGFLMCLGRLASENEILILRASGQNYRTILKPVLILGILISIVSFFVNDYLLPLGTINYNKLYRSILTSNPAVELESNSIKRTNDKTLVIGDVEGENVSDLIFFDTDNDGGQRIIVADSSMVKKSSAPGVLMKLIMNDASVIMFDQNKKNDYDVLTSENVELNIFESTFLESNRSISPREMTSYDLYKEIKSMKNNAEVTKKKRNQYNLEMAKKFSMPFGSIFFAILALPLALIFGKHNGQTIGLIIGLFISVFYWAVSIVGQIFSSRTGVYGVTTMWAPNIFIGVAGILFYLRLLRK